MKKKITFTVLLSAAASAFTVCAALPEFPSFAPARAITSGPKDHFFASYYAVNSWCSQNRYALVLETDIKSSLPEGREAVLGLVDTEAGNRFIPVTTTRCWNFQEATMAHWMPWRSTGVPRARPRISHTWLK